MIVNTTEGFTTVWKFYSFGKIVYLTYTQIPNITSRSKRKKIFTLLNYGLNECRRHMRI